ncbi:hypothetical protein Bbelb_058940 [Branchiostoma belcheri]|nr:hypothetical protein Bbelb_058940 [Branchiostoma belcheri]
MRFTLEIRAINKVSTFSEMDYPTSSIAEEGSFNGDVKLQLASRSGGKSSGTMESGAARASLQQGRDLKTIEVRHRSGRQVKCSRKLETPVDVEGKTVSVRRPKL